MKNTWNYDLMDLLQNARLGNSKELNSFLEKYAPLAVANGDCSVLLLFRHFEANFKKNDISVFNCHPEKENFQCGITIVTSSEKGDSQSNIFLPNHFNYKELKIRNKEIEIITEDNKVHKTNVAELFKKLNFWGNFTKEEVENAFNSLCNEQPKKNKKAKVKHKTIQIPSLGEFTFNEEHEWYEGKFIENDLSFEINIHHTKKKKLENLIVFTDIQMQNKFYEEMLLAMEKKMIKLKNKTWLGEDELPITIDDFRKRISIDSIVFFEDCSSVIYCNDGDIFWGHSIEIDSNKKGKYKSAKLVG